MNRDSEIKALQEANEAIKSLDDEAKQRVLRYLSNKYAVSGGSRGAFGEELIQARAGDESVSTFPITSFEDLSEIFSKADPESDADKVLLAAAYLQEKNSRTELTGREINRELHHLGHGVGNVTNAISSLINRRPQLMIQIRKEGKTQQAQKKYKVTREGIRKVKEMLALRGDEARK